MPRAIFCYGFEIGEFRGKSFKEVIEALCRSSRSNLHDFEPKTFQEFFRHIGLGSSSAILIECGSPGKTRYVLAAQESMCATADEVPVNGAVWQIPKLVEKQRFWDGAIAGFCKKTGIRLRDPQLLLAIEY